MIPRRVLRTLESFTHPHPVGQVLTSLNPRWTLESVATVTSIEPLTPRSVRITMRTNRAWPGHTAGQYVPVGIEINGRREQRTYSLTTKSSEAGTTEIAIAVQRVADGLVSNHLNSTLTVGTLVHLGTPMGDFVLDDAPSTSLLLVGAGSGLTPIRGLVAELEQRRQRTGAAPEVTVLAIAPSADERLFADEFAAAAERHPWLTVRFVDTQTPGAAASGIVRFGLDMVSEYCTDWKQRRTYVCGPTSILDAATELFEAHDLGDQLVVERFTRTLPPRSGLAETPSVTVSLAGAIATLDLPTDAPILDGIEAAGQLAPVGCRNGICHTCSVEILDGCAKNLRDGRVSEAGSHVQICISAPLTDLTLAL